MNLELRGIENIGDLDRERVVMRAIQNVDIGDYAVLRCNPAENGVASGNVPGAFWFLDKTINKGDLVVLYSKSGVSSAKTGLHRVTYFYYWGKSQSQWTDHKIALVHTSSWDFWPKPT
jgi:predicted Mrr-cat superfamily restriction endonuclease